MGNRGFYGFSKGSFSSKYGFPYESEVSLVQESGLVLWLDANQIAGLSNDDPVAQWDDMTGRGNHFTQATAASKPLYKTNYLNSMPGLYFDGSNDFMYGPSLNLNANYQRTIMAVARLRHTTNRCPIFGWGSSSTNYFMIDANTYLTGGSKWGMYLPGGNTFDTDASTSLDAALITLQVNSMSGAVVSTVNYYIDNTLTSLTKKTGGDDWGTLTSAAYTGIARFPGISVYGGADVFEIQVYNRALTNSEVLGLGGGLGAKWGLW